MVGIQDANVVTKRQAALQKTLFKESFSLLQMMIDGLMLGFSLSMRCEYPNHKYLFETRARSCQ